jgi:hypothetical protein
MTHASHVLAVSCPYASLRPKWLLPRARLLFIGGLTLCKHCVLYVFNHVKRVQVDICPTAASVAAAQLCLWPDNIGGPLLRGSEFPSLQTRSVLWSWWFALFSCLGVFACSPLVIVWASWYLLTTFSCSAAVRPEFCARRPVLARRVTTVKAVMKLFIVLAMYRSTAVLSTFVLQIFAGVVPIPCHLIGSLETLP